MLHKSNKFIRDHGRDRDGKCDHDGKCGHDRDHDVEFCYALPFYTSCYIFSKEKKINSIIKICLNNYKNIPK